MIKPWILLAIALILDTAGSVLFKYGTNQLASLGNATEGGHLNNILNAIKRKEIILGVVVYIVEYIVWIAYISTTPLNVAFSMSSLNVVLVLIASRLILKERVSQRRCLGALFILIGVFLVGG